MTFRTALSPSSTSSSHFHPFSPLTPDEIILAGKLLKYYYPNVDIQFKAITLQEPEKQRMVAWMNKTGPKPPRLAYVPYYIRNTEKFFEAIVNLSERKVQRNANLTKNGVHGAVDPSEIFAVERVIMEDEGVRKELEKLKLSKDTVVVCDPWIYGTDGNHDERRQCQCFLYARPAAEPDSNYYALPLSISPVVDLATLKVTRIDRLPTGSDFTIPPEPKKFVSHPANEYAPEHQKLRTDLKPLHVVQPEGASFTVTCDDDSSTGNILSWQKWKFRVGFNYREGVVLYDVTYDGRSLFYRLSLSDMNIPYGDPRPPYHKKAAFDFGDVGAGVMANNLQLGCDCLGAIHYLSGWISDDRGYPLEKPNCICIHEQDNGIGWKHSNYRTGRAAVVRNRELVVQSIITVANYDYILAWIFNQAGEVTYEVRATGILSTCPIDDDADIPDWGTLVHPGVLAQHHQHLFSLRVDPALDGHDNRLVFDEALALPRDPETNPYGVGYVTKETVVSESCGLNTDVEKNRIFKIQNSEKRNPINGKPVAYKIVAPPFQKMLADKESWHYKRAEFADKAIYVTKYRDGELYAAGKFTNQSRGGDGVRTWSSRKDNVKDTDIVVWVQFGLNHIPRIEDFPVMPCETLRVSLKPVNFFEKNPALDVPPSNQFVNRSVLLSQSNPTSNLNDQSCCPIKPKSVMSTIINSTGKGVSPYPSSSPVPISINTKAAAACCESSSSISSPGSFLKESVHHEEDVNAYGNEEKAKDIDSVGKKKRLRYMQQKANECCRVS